MAALDAAADAVMILDRAGIVRYVNHSCLVLLARERAEQRTVGRHVLGLTCLEGGSLRQIMRAVHEQGLWSGTLQVEIGPRRRTLELCVCRTLGETSRAQSFSIVARPAARPATTTRPATALAHPAGQPGADVLGTVARVASEMAHDFNNQIAVVLNYSFILLRELPGKSPMRAHVTELQSAAWRAAEVAREILRFGARRNLEPAEIDVNQLLQAAQGILGAMLGAGPTGATAIELRLSSERCRVLARRAQLEWLLFELSARLRARLGKLERLRLSTSTTLSGNKLERPRVMIALDAHASQRPLLGAPGAADPSPAQDSSAEQGLRAAERALEHARGELTLHVLPDGGLRYLICLPAARA